LTIEVNWLFSDLFWMKEYNERGLLLLTVLDYIIQYHDKPDISE